jgi:hypothetical protein
MRTVGGNRGELPLLAIALVIIVIIAVVSMVLFVPWKVTNVDESRALTVTDEVEELDLSVDQDIGKVGVYFTDSDQDHISMTVKGQLRQNLLASGDPLTITWASEFVGGRAVLNAMIDVEAYATTYGNDELVTTITIPSQLSTMVNVSGDTGSSELVAGNGIVLRGGHLSEAAGSTKATLANCTLNGNLILEATTGSCKLEWTEVKVGPGVQVSADSTTGSVELDVLQTKALGDNVSFSAGANTGGIELDLNIEGGISSRVISNTDVGGITVKSSTGFTGSDDNLTSINYPSDEVMNFAIDANVGGVELSLEYLA